MPTVQPFPAGGYRFMNHQFQYSGGVAAEPGFRIERGEYSMAVEVGVLPSNKLFYRDREQDKYLTMDEFTRRILDRVLFPKLRD